MKKFCLAFCTLFFITTDSFSQNPYNGIPYQAVMRNNTGDPIADSTINLLFQLRSGSAQGNIIYAETQTVITNGQGLMSAFIGNGQASLGNFDNIDWKSYPMYLQVMMNGVEMGSQELKSVPYAIQSKYAEKVRVDLSPNGDTLLVGDTLIAVSQFNAGLNGTGELINDQSGMVQSTTLNLDCAVDGLPYLRIKACDMDATENMYFLLEYEGEHDFYGMHLSCNATRAYTLCKVNANGIVVWTKNILCPSGLRNTSLATSISGRILLSSSSDGTNNGGSTYPFQVQLPEITLSYANRATFMLLFDSSGNYLDHENIPGDGFSGFFSANDQGYASIAENQVGTNPTIAAMRMYQYSGNTINLLWRNSTTAWASCINLKMDPIEPVLHCIFEGGTQYLLVGYTNSYYRNYVYKKFQNNTELFSKDLIRIQDVSPKPQCDFILENNFIYLTFLGDQVAIYNNSSANTIADMPTLKIPLSLTGYEIVNTESTGYNSQMTRFFAANTSHFNAAIESINSYNTSTYNFGNTIVLNLVSGGNLTNFTLHESGNTSQIPASKIKGAYIINNKLYLMGDYDCQSYSMGLLDCQFPLINGKRDFPFILKTNLTP